MYCTQAAGRNAAGQSIKDAASISGDMHAQELLPEANLLPFVQRPDGSYNGCHFWSKFEILDLGFLRSAAYTAYFAALDASGGFFLERWGDAPVHTLAAALFLNSSQVSTRPASAIVSRAPCRSSQTAKGAGDER